MMLNEKYAGLNALDPALMPSPTHRIAVVSGSWRDMGRQYAAQCAGALLARGADVLSEYISFCGGSEKAFSTVSRYLEAPSRDYPELIELLDGMAEASSLCREVCAMIFYGKSMLRAEQECSHAAAWDGATADGHMIGACNVDLGTDASDYLPVILAFPEKGHAFFSGENFHRNGMNETGLLLQCSGGQNAGPGDTIAPGCRHMWNDANAFALANCSTAEETVEAYRRWSYVTGCNQFVGDSGHDARVIEFTASKFAVRRAGDFGERDYLLANNDYMCPELQNSIFRGALYWDDTRPRYWTVAELMRRAHGAITPDTLAEIEGCYGFYIPEGWALAPQPDGGALWVQTTENTFPAGWHEDLTLVHAQWSPQMRSPFGKPASRFVMDADTRTVWGMRDGQNTLYSHAPHSLGTFWKLQLCKSADETALKARAELEMQLFFAARDAESGNYAEKAAGVISRAKQCLFYGNNRRAMAQCLRDSGDADGANAALSDALSFYCEGQCLARLAQKEPRRLVQSID